MSMESFGQRWKRDRHHFIFGMGASGFMGDLGGADQEGTNGLRDFNFSAVRPSLVGGYRYMLLENVGVTGNLTYGFVSGNDSHTQEPYRNNRNIHFRSPILELSAQAQYYFLTAHREGARHGRITGARGVLRRFELALYAFAGIGGFWFNPQAHFDASNYNGSVPTEELPPNGWYNLRPLSTEGQGFFPTRDKYPSISMAIPFGIGAMLPLNRDLSIGIEFGYRKTFTDYIDDVSTTYVDPKIFSQMFEDPEQIALAEYFSNPSLNSLSENVTAPGQQRGSPHSTDAYMFTFITVYYRVPQLRPTYGLPRF